MGRTQVNDLLRVYATFDASHSKNPARTDLKYYFLLRAWLQRGPLAGAFVDVHGGANPRKPADLRSELVRRLGSSDLLLLILSERSPASKGWLSWEIEQGAGELGLPVLCGYAGRATVDVRSGYAAWWPAALCRILSERDTRAFHVPFRPHALAQGMRAGLQARAHRRHSAPS